MDQIALAEIQAYEAAQDYKNPRYMELLMAHHYIYHLLRMPLEEWPEPVTRSLDGEDADLLAVLAEMARDPLLLATAGALLVSHAYAFWANELRTGAWRTASAEKLMTRPYGRSAVVHLFIFAAALAVEQLGSPLAAMLAFVALKTALDAKAHRRERAASRSAP